MPEATYPAGFETSLVKALNEEVPKVAKRFIRERARKLAATKLELTGAASRFLTRYRNLLLENYLIQNLRRVTASIEWRKFLHGPGDPEDLKNVPIAGMLGLPPRVRLAIFRVVESIRVGSPFVDLVFTETRRGLRGELRFNFGTFQTITDAAFRWGGPVNWITLLEYGVSVGTHNFLGFLEASPYSRSGGGIMGKGGHFFFPPTYVFADTFQEALSILTPKELLSLRVKFIRG